MKMRRLVSLCAIALFCLFVIYSADAREGAQRGLALWGTLLVPSLLPFFAAAGLLTRLGVIDAICRRLTSRKGSGVFSGPALGVFLLGLSGGYPLGAASAAEAVKAGSLSPEEGSELLVCCDNTGPAFAVGAIGTGLFGSAWWGLLLWGVHALTAAAIAAVLCRKRRHTDAGLPCRSVTPPGEAFSAAVSGAVSALISIGGYVVFFSALLGVTEALGFPGSLSRTLAGFFGGQEAYFRALLTGLLELSSGIGAMRGLPLSPGSLALASLLMGWGGLCVHLQAAAVVRDAGLRLTGRLPGKLLHGILSAAVTYFLAQRLL